MHTPPLPADETARLDTLYRCEILGTQPEPSFDGLVDLAAAICVAPIALVTFIDPTRQWSKSKIGWSAPEIHRDISFCAHTILGREVFIVEDASTDVRFADNPLVTGSPHIRFYAGAPIVLSNGTALGTVAVIDTVSRRLSVEQTSLLTKLAGLAAALLENRQKMRHALVVAGMGDGIWDWDCAAGYTYLSPRWKELLGYQDHELTNREESFFERVHPDDLAPVHAAIRAHLEHRKPYATELRLRRKDGSYAWFFSRGQALWDEDDKPTRMVGAIADITARKLAETKFRDLLEAAPDGLVIVGANGRIMLVNQQTERLFGYSRTELLDQPIEMLLPKRFHAQHTGHRAGFFADPRVRPMGSGLELWAQHHDGHEFPVEISLSPLETESGRLVTAAIRDVSARKLAEEALRASEVFSREILDSLSAQVAVTDASGVIILVNRVWERTALINDSSGLARVSTGANYLQVCERAADNSSEVRQILAGILDVLAGEKQVFKREYLCAWSGHQQWFSMRVTSLTDRRGCVIAHEDITERKRTEEALQDSYQRLQVLSRELQVAKERERSRLARELHDEFGQVLSGLKFDLISIASALVKSRAGPVDVVHARVMRALGMVDRLFESLRGMVAALRPALLEQLGLISALESLATDIQERSALRCDVVTDRVTREICYGIEVEIAIYRMVQELLANVVRHAKATSATVTLRYADGWVLLTVQDDGRGFDVRHVRKAIQFGLQGIQERAELLGGQVQINSKPRVGTVVTIQVPLELPAPPQKPVVPIQRPKSGTTRKRR
jgi:PAS domain S-box-containing protein